MSKVVNGKTYYLLEESSKMLDDSIEKSADLLISELKNRKNARKLRDNNLVHV